MSLGTSSWRQPAASGRGRMPEWLRSWEEWITFGLLAAALFAVMASIEASDWVDEMPSLAVAAGLGLCSGWALAHLPRAAWPLHLAGIGSGVAVVIAMVMQTMQLADPILHSGIRGRWDELWSRNGDWVAALRAGDLSSDPLPFVLMMTALAWALGYLAAWAVGRWRNAWLALAPAGIVLLTNISYLPGQPSRWFVVFLFAALLLFARLQLTRASERSQHEGGEVPTFLSLEVLHATWWVGLLLVGGAWLLPVGANLGPFEGAWERVSAPITDRTDRLGRAFVGIGSKRPTIIHGSPDTLPLQGRVTLSSEPLLRVEAPEDAPYLRLASFDAYTSAGWTVSDTQRLPLPDTPFDELSAFGTSASREQFRAPVMVSVQVDQAFADRRLLTVGDPIAADRDGELVAGAAPADVLGVSPDDRVDDGDRYATVGTVSLASEQALVEAGGAYPAWVRDRYLALPDGLPPDVAQLAATITTGSGSPYIAARLIEQYLRDRYPVDLAIDRPPPRTDAVAYFLFDAQRGYFDYHASAMAVMLRTLGIPARVSTGFALDSANLDPETRQYVLTEEQSWTWPEVYFPGFGWVEFNPTPGRNLIARPLDEVTPTAPDVLDPVDSLAALGNDELLFGPNVRIDDMAPAESLSEGGGAAAVVSTAIVVILATTGGLLAILVLTRVLWERGLRGLDAAPRRWAVTLRLAGWAGLRIDPHQTPLEVARMIDGMLGPEAGARPVATAYSRARYGGAPAVTDTDSTEARTEYLALRNALWRAWLRRWRPARRSQGSSATPTIGRPAG